MDKGYQLAVRRPQNHRASSTVMLHGLSASIMTMQSAKAPATPFNAGVYQKS
jgi:hypothetical protein